MNPKLATYVGFAIKSGQIVYGYDKIKMSRKRIHLILADSATAENTMTKVTDYSNKNKIPMITLSDIDKITAKENCKIIALTSKELSQAVISLLNT